jgi:hypothetical protein
MKTSAKIKLVIMNVWPQESLESEIREKIVIILRFEKYFDHFNYSLVLDLKIITIFSCTSDLSDSCGHAFIMMNYIF